MRQALAFCLLASAISLPAPVQAHEFFSTKITWTREISRIVYRSCAGCHRDGGSAFSLLTFEQARPWAAAIKEEVLQRRMPPWGAAKGFGAFQHDAGLSQDEISLIADWVEGGAPEGQKNYLPKTPAPLAAASQLKFREQPLSQAPLRANLTVAGIAPRGPIPPGAQVTIELPDGSTEPLIWILDPKAATQRNFLFAQPRTFPPASRFSISKPGGLWKLLLAPANGTTASR